ncbi:hypothetical protein PAMP_023965 [Pampus punctatissimus]
MELSLSARGVSPTCTHTWTHGERGSLHVPADRQTAASGLRCHKTRFSEYKKLQIRVEFFHPTPSTVKGHNIWVCRGHGGRGLQTLAAFSAALSDFSLKSLYLQPHVHYCTNTRDATGLPKPHHSLPACSPQRESEGKREKRVVFLRMFDLSPDYLQGDSTKAHQKLGWKPKVTFEELVKEMVDADIQLMKKNPNA